MVPRWKRGLALIAMLLASGCITYDPAPRPRPLTEHLEIRHQQRGTCRVTEFDEDTWYVLQGNQLLVLDPTNGEEVFRLTLAPNGQAGPAVGMIIRPTSIVVVLRDSQVVVLDRTAARRVFVERRYSAAELGIAPRGLVETPTGVVVLGKGGAVHLPSLTRLVDHDDEVQALVDHPEGALFVVNRRVYRVADSGYVGSASALLPLADSAAVGVAVPEGSMLFWRNLPQGGLAGFAVLEKGILREVDVDDSTVAIPGEVRRVRMRGDRVLMVGSRGVRIYRLDPQGVLRNLWSRSLPGCRDADFMDDRDIVAVGEFGIVRLRTDQTRDDEVVRHDMPGGLLQAISDGRRIFATGVDGTWEYRIGDSAEVVAPQDWVYPDPPRDAALLGWDVKIIDQGRRAVVSNRVGTASLPAPIGSRFLTVVGSDGAFWLGHETGMVMMKPPKNPAVLPSDWDNLSAEERDASGRSVLEGIQKLSVQIDGPVIFIQPLMLGGGVAFAAVNGGFGVVREIF